MDYFNELKAALDKIDDEELNHLFESLIETRQDNGRVFVIGNGGSMATAIHFAADLTKNAEGFRAFALDNQALFSAYANDESYEWVFVNQLLKFNCGIHDLIICLSTSGHSENIINVINTFKTEIFFLTANPHKFETTNKILTAAPCIEVAEDLHSIILHSMIKRLKDAQA